MLEISEESALRAVLGKARAEGKAIGFVPTMGYLHAGHLRLLEAARAENEVVVLSIYINPTQFGPAEDLTRYPQDTPRDRRLAVEASVDILFAPQDATMYPDGPQAQQIWVDPGPLAGHLDGAARPGHFRGVATVVTKLFNLVRPDRAYFGEKDLQQLVIIQRLVRDLAFGIEIKAVPTEREPDGLARSSRNVFLTSHDRAQAASLSAALEHGRALLRSGERNAGTIATAVRDIIESGAPRARIDFVTVADLTTLVPIPGTIAGDVVLALAVYFGTTRLIDNTVVRFGADGSMA